MALTASQLDQLHRTLLEAFTQDEMRRLLRVCMGVNFDQVITSNKPFVDQVWDLAVLADQVRGFQVDSVHSMLDCVLIAQSFTRKTYLHPG